MTSSIADILGRHRLFKGMASEVLAELAVGASFVDLRGGAVLFEAGTKPDAMYLVVTGRLRGSMRPGHYSYIGVGETVGEIGVLTNQTRLFHIVAVRDSHLIRLERQLLLDALLRHPQALLALTQIEILRLQSHHGMVEPQGQITNLAVLETRFGRGGREFMRRMAGALERYGSVCKVDEKVLDEALGEGIAEVPYARNEANRDLVRWLNEVETQTDFLIYSACRNTATWQRRCLRQADHILLLADVEDSYDATLDVLRELRSQKINVPVSMVFRRSERSRKGEPTQWIHGLEASGHFYWRPGKDDDIESIVRQLIERGNGLVLGGGGARGFAHIGLIRALDELGIPVDFFGGSSMGALIAALRAQGLNSLEIVREVRASFVEKNFLNDFMLPRVALIRGKRFLRRMHDIFGNLRIEDLPAPFFCVSTNLTDGSCVVHRDGPLDMWIATSMAVPGVAPPVAWKGDFLADGAVINALPTDVMSEWNRGMIIASSVSTEGMIAAPGVEGPDPEALFHWKSEEPRPSLFDILFRTATLTSESGNARRAELADFYLKMPVTHIGMFQWDAIDEVVRLGYEFAMRELADQRGVLTPP